MSRWELITNLAVEHPVQKITRGLAGRRQEKEQALDSRRQSSPENPQNPKARTDLAPYWEDPINNSPQNPKARPDLAEYWEDPSNNSSGHSLDISNTPPRNNRGIVPEPGAVATPPTPDWVQASDVPRSNGEDIERGPGTEGLAVARPVGGSGEFVPRAREVQPASRQAKTAQQNDQHRQLVGCALLVAISILVVAVGLGVGLRGGGN